MANYCIRFEDIDPDKKYFIMVRIGNDSKMYYKGYADVESGYKDIENLEIKLEESEYLYSQ